MRPDTPELRALVTRWWDERQGFLPGITAGVLADYLEERHDYRETNLPSVLRAGDGPMRGDDLEWLNALVPVFSISTASAPNPTFRILLEYLGYELLRTAMVSPFGERQLILSEEDARRLSRSQELREQIYYGGFFDGFALAKYGLPDRIYGWHITVLPHMQRGYVNAVCGSHLAIGRVC